MKHRFVKDIKAYRTKAGKWIRAHKKVIWLSSAAALAALTFILLERGVKPKRVLSPREIEERFQKAINDPVKRKSIEKFLRDEWVKKNVRTRIVKRANGDWYFKLKAK